MPPIPWDASSIILKPYCFESLKISFISQDCPERWTGITIFGNLSSFFAISNLVISASIDILYVRESMSTKSTLAPQYKAQFEEATNDIGLVQIISFFDKPSAIHEIWRADVALFTATP